MDLEYQQLITSISNLGEHLRRSILPILTRTTIARSCANIIYALGLLLHRHGSNLFICLNQIYVLGGLWLTHATLYIKFSLKNSLIEVQAWSCCPESCTNPPSGIAACFSYSTTTVRSMSDLDFSTHFVAVIRPRGLVEEAVPDTWVIEQLKIHIWQLNVVSTD